MTEENERATVVETMIDEALNEIRALVEKSGEDVPPERELVLVGLSQYADVVAGRREFPHKLTGDHPAPGLLNEAAAACLKHILLMERNQSEPATARQVLSTAILLHYEIASGQRIFPDRLPPVTIEEGAKH